MIGAMAWPSGARHLVPMRSHQGISIVSTEAAVALLETRLQPLCLLHPTQADAVPHLKRLATVFIGKNILAGCCCRGMKPKWA